LQELQLLLLVVEIILGILDIIKSLLKELLKFRDLITQHLLLFLKLFDLLIVAFVLAAELFEMAVDHVFLPLLFCFLGSKVAKLSKLALESRLSVLDCLEHFIYHAACVTVCNCIVPSLLKCCKLVEQVLSLFIETRPGPALSQCLLLGLKLGSLTVNRPKQAVKVTGDVCNLVLQVRAHIVELSASLADLIVELSLACLLQLFKQQAVLALLQVVVLLCFLSDLVSQLLEVVH
jgi:hypothetical protein